MFQYNKATIRTGRNIIKISRFGNFLGLRTPTIQRHPVFSKRVFEGKKRFLKVSLQQLRGLRIVFQKRWKKLHLRGMIFKHLTNI